MKRALFFLLLFIAYFSAPAHASEVLVITAEGPINPVTAEYITTGIKRAGELNAQALIIELDTPGGLDSSMRLIVKEMLASPVPVVVYVAPRGARAASAGAFITIAAHIAAMAPQTNIGAAHPVAVGEKMDEVMSSKATNDAAAYIKSLAEKRGRNVQWAEDAVRKSISSTETEALEKHVIDLVANDIPSLLAAIDGKEVETSTGKLKLNTKDAKVTRSPMTNRLKILAFLSDPNVAYILMILGFYGIFFEMTNPGALFPGVVGGICLILAFYAFQTLTVNYAGLLLIILSLILFALEIKITSHGALAIGGMIAMTIGSVMLFESSEPYFRLSMTIVATVVITTAVFFLGVVRLVVQAQRARPTTGAEGLSGEQGVAITDITPQEGGQVHVHGEIWSAHSDSTIPKGAPVRVLSMSGLKVKVEQIQTGGQ